MEFYGFVEVGTFCFSFFATKVDHDLIGFKPGSFLSHLLCLEQSISGQKQLDRNNLICSRKQKLCLLGFVKNGHTHTHTYMQKKRGRFDEIVFLCIAQIGDTVLVFPLELHFQDLFDLFLCSQS